MSGLRGNLGQTLTLGFTLLLAVMLGFIAGIGMVPVATLSSLAVAILIAALACVYLLILWLAVLGRPMAVAAYLALIVFLIDFSVRPQDLFRVPHLDAQSLMKLLVWGGALLIGVAHLRATQHLFAGAKALGISLFAIWAVFSAIYSYSPSYTLAAGIAFTGLVVFAPVVILKLSLRQILLTAGMSLGVMVALSFLMYLVAPQYALEQLFAGDELRFRGLTGSPNAMGGVVSLFLIACLLLWSKQMVRPWTLLVVIPMAALGLYMSQSRTAGTAAVIAYLAAGGLIRRSRLLVVAAIGGVLCAALLLMVASYGDIQATLAHLSRSGRSLELYTFNNRTDIWAYAWRKFEQSPWLGYGYASTRTLMLAEYYTAWGYTATHAHNLILQCLITTGVIGTTFILAVFVGQARDFLREPSPFRDVVFLYVVLTGLLEPGAIGVTPNLLTILWMLSLFQRTQQESREPTIVIAGVAGPGSGKGLFVQECSPEKSVVADDVLSKT